jgi:hypothetical protein
MAMEGSFKIKKSPGASRVFRSRKRRRLALDFVGIVAGRDSDWIGKSEKKEKSVGAALRRFFHVTRLAQ